MEKPIWWIEERLSNLDSKDSPLGLITRCPPQ